jgi:hypothetical protein
VVVRAGLLHFRANRSPPTSTGLTTTPRLTDAIWDRPDTALVVVLTVGTQMIVGFLWRCCSRSSFPAGACC